MSHQRFTSQSREAIYAPWLRNENVFKSFSKNGHKRREDLMSRYFYNFVPEIEYKKC